MKVLGKSSIKTSVCNVVPSLLFNTAFFVILANFSSKRLRRKTALKLYLERAPTSRPIGVTIIAILNIIGGITTLIAAITLITIGAILPTLHTTTVTTQTQQLQGNLTSGQTSTIPPSVVTTTVSPSIFGGIGIAIGAVLLAIAIASFVVAYGLLKGLGWAWTVTVILSIISIVFNVVSIAAGNIGSIVSIIISGIILYYLYRPHVKAYFGKGMSRSPYSI